MPGILHQGVLSLFCLDPWLAFDLLGRSRPGSGPLRDRRAEAEAPVIASSKLTVGLPDLVLASDLPAHKGGLVVCVEAQLALDRDKRYAIPFYQGALAYQHKLPTWVVIVAYAKSISTALEQWSRGAPPRPDVLILDRQRVPVPQLELANTRPTAALLAATLHGCMGHLDAVRVGIEATRKLSRPHRLRYLRTLLAAVPEHLRHIIEQELTVEEYDPLWEIERKSSPYVYGVREGLEKGRAEGRTVLHQLILELLDSRGISLDETTRARLAGCEDLDLLRTWARRSGTISAASELFTDS